MDRDAFAACPDDSIDYALMEKTDLAAMVPLDGGWSDIGSWSALWEVSDKDADGNVLKGDVLARACQNNHIHADSRLVAAVGVQDLVIVETRDAVLVAHRDQVQDVKKVVEQIRNDVCYHEAKVTFVSVGGGFSYGALGMSHHATEDIAIMRALPNVTVLAPGSRWETRQLMPHVVAHKSPVYLRLERSGEEVPNGAGPFEFGKARVLREGTDITLISTGGVLTEVLGAAELLSVSGIEARVVSMHSVKPLDVAAIEAAATETGGIVTIEEHSIIGGLGGAVAEVSLEARWRPALFARIGLNDVYSSVVGSQEYLRRYYGMDRSAIADRTQALLGK